MIVTAKHHYHYFLLFLNSETHVTMDTCLCLLFYNACSIAETCRTVRNLCHVVYLPTPSNVAFFASIKQIACKYLFLFLYFIMITKFTIPELDKTELLNKLSEARYPNELQDEYKGWKYGSPTWAVKEMVDYWKTGFSFDKFHDEINCWQHYQIPINDLRIHFIHEPSAQESSIPIILLHGWPSTFYEFHKIIKPLRDHPTQVYMLL